MQASTSARTVCPLRCKISSPSSLYGSTATSPWMHVCEPRDVSSTEHHKNYIFDKGFFWNAGGVGGSAIGEILRNKLRDIGHQVFDPVVEICHDRIEEVMESNADKTDLKITLVLTGGCFENLALRRMIRSEIGEDFPNVLIEEQIEFSQFVIYGGLLRLANMLRDTSRINRIAARDVFRLSLAKLSKIPPDNGYNIPAEMYLDSTRWSSLDYTGTCYLKDVLVWFWNKRDRYRRVYEIECEHQIDISQDLFIEEILYVSPRRQEHYYRPSDPENGEAIACSSVKFSVSKCVDAGILRAAVDGKLEGPQRSANLYHWHRMPRRRRVCAEQARVQCWVAKFVMTVENNGIELRVSARAKGAKLSEEVLPFSGPLRMSVPFN